FFSSRRRHTRCLSDWSSDVCSSDLGTCGVRIMHWRYPPAELARCLERGNILWTGAGTPGPGRSLQLLLGCAGDVGVSLDFSEARSEERRVGKECRWRRRREPSKEAR